jgi:hypothetical protein
MLDGSDILGAQDLDWGWEQAGWGKGEPCQFDPLQLKE